MSSLSATVRETWQPYARSIYFTKNHPLSSLSLRLRLACGSQVFRSLRLRDLSSASDFRLNCVSVRIGRGRRCAVLFPQGVHKLWNLMSFALGLFVPLFC
jgi:hypothetical protein